AADAFGHALGEPVAGAEVAGEGLEFGLLREALVPEEEDGLLEGRVPGERPDRDADVLEDALLAVDEGHLRLGSDDARQALDVVLGHTVDTPWGRRASGVWFAAGPAGDLARGDAGPGLYGATRA